MEAAVGKPVSPGDVVARLPPSGELRVGPGLDADPSTSTLTTSRPGLLRRTRGGKLWVAGRATRYAPSPGDAVVGVVTERGADAFGVDVGGAFPATLPALAFEGATRRNRPPLARGDAVLARVAAADPHVDAELSCVDEGGRAAGFGPLAPGIVLTVPTSYARALAASPPPPILAAVGGVAPFDLAVGANGRVWVGGADAAAVVAAARAIAAGEHADEATAAALAAEAGEVARRGAAAG